MQPPPKGWKGLLSLVTWELSSCLTHLSSSIASARPPWQRIRHGTKQTKQNESAVVGPASSECFVCSAADLAEPPIAHTPNLRKECGLLALGARRPAGDMRRLDSARGRSFRVVANLWRSARPAHKPSAARIVWCAQATPCSAIREGNDESRHLGCAPRSRRSRLPRQPGRHGCLEDACRPDPRRERDRLRAAAGHDHGRLVHRDRCRTDHPLWLCARRRLGRRHRSQLAYGRRRPVRGRRSDLVTILIPIQIAQTRLSRRFAATGAIPDRYWRLAQRWYVFAAVATLLPLANVFVMALKP